MLEDKLNGGIGVEVTPTPPIQDPVVDTVNPPVTAVDNKIYEGGQLPEVVINVETPESKSISDFRKSYDKTNSKKDFISKRLTPFARRLGNSETNYPKSIDEAYDRAFKRDYAKHMETINPRDIFAERRDGKSGPKKFRTQSRGEWLDRLADDEWELVKDQPQYKQTMLMGLNEGVKAIINPTEQSKKRSLLNKAGSAVSGNVEKFVDKASELTNFSKTFGLSALTKNLSDKNLSSREKEALIKDYESDELLTDIGQMARVFEPLGIPAKVVQAAFRDDYSLSDALQGKQNNASLIEDIITDPLNFTGFGAGTLTSSALVDKFQKLNKLSDFKNIADAKNLSGLSRIVDKTGSKIGSVGRFTVDNLKDLKSKPEELLNTLQTSALKSGKSKVPYGDVNYLESDMVHMRMNIDERSRLYSQIDDEYSKLERQLNKRGALMDERDAVEDLTQGLNKYDDQLEATSKQIQEVKGQLPENTEKLLIGDNTITGYSVDHDKTSVTFTKRQPKSLNVIDSQYNARTHTDTGSSVNFNTDGTVTYTDDTRKLIEDDVTNTITEVEKMFPGGKVIGSSKLYANHNLPDIPGDFDITITKADWDKVDKTNMTVKPTNEYNNVVNIDIDGKTFEFDVNVVDNATESRLKTEVNWYGDGSDAETVFKNQIDPEIKSITDVIVSQKDKHGLKPEALITFSNNQSKVQEAYNTVGRAYTGPNFEPLPKLEFGSFKDNLKLLEDINFKGYKDVVAANPDKMQTAIMQYHLDNTVVNRSVNTNFTSTPESILSSFTEWKPEMGGGSGAGFGLNTVSFGDSQFGSELQGFMQIKGDFNNKTGREVVDYIKSRYIDRVLTPEEATKLNQKMLELGLGTGIENATNLHQYQNVINNKFTSWVAEELDVVSSKTTYNNTYDDMTYGNSKYRGVLKNLKEDEIALKYDNASKMESPKSESLRDKILKSQGIRDIVSVINNAKITKAEMDSQISNLISEYRESIKKIKTEMFEHEALKYDGVAMVKNKLDEIPETGVNSSQAKDVVSSSRIIINRYSKSLTDLIENQDIRQSKLLEEQGLNYKNYVTLYEDIKKADNMIQNHTSNVKYIADYIKLIDDVIEHATYLSSIEKDIARIESLKIQELMYAKYNKEGAAMTAASKINDVINE